MKRFLIFSLLAAGLTLGSQQQASAWCNFKFGAGVNWHWQSGNNSWFCGAYRNGEVPGPEFFGYPGCGGGYPVGYGGGYDSFPYYGAGQPVPGQPSYAAGAPQMQAAPTNNVPQQVPTTPIPNYQQRVQFQPTAYQSYYPSYYQSYYPTYYNQFPTYYNWGFNYYGR
jgi:hypothetical protein